MDDYEGLDYKSIEVYLNEKLTGRELANQVIAYAKGHKAINKNIRRIRVAEQGNGRAGLDSISGLFSPPNQFPALDELIIEVPVSTITSDDLANVLATQQKLQISSKTLKIFPVFPKNLKNLRRLDLDDNQIDTINGSIFKHLTELKNLNLSKNKITTIGAETFVGSLRLMFLNLENNRIITIHERAFKSLECLFELNLSNNRLKNIESTKIFESNKNLRSLYIENNQIETIHENVLIYAPELKELFLSINRIKKIQNVLNTLKNLKILKLSHNPVTDIDFVELAKLPYLEKLELISTQPSFSSINANVTSKSPLLRLILKGCKIQYCDQLNGLCLLFPKLMCLDLTENSELNKLGIVDKKSLQSYKPNTKKKETKPENKKSKK